MAVNLDACIHCNLCVRACREVQVNDVIGMAYRNNQAKIVFDMDDPMGRSTCVACGECVQACPTGALMPATLVDEDQVGHVEMDREVDSVCPYCGVGCQITYHIKDDEIRYVTGRNGPANENRLCVKGRFGFDYVSHDDRLTVPLIRKEGVAKVVDDDIDPAESLHPFPRGDLGRGAGRRRQGLARHSGQPRFVGACWFRLGQGIQRGGLSGSKAGSDRLRHQQCRSLHAALPRVLGGGADGEYRLGCGDGAIHGGEGCRRHHRDRRESDRESSGGGDLISSRRPRPERH